MQSRLQSERPRLYTFQELRLIQIQEDQEVLQALLASSDFSTIVILMKWS